MSPVFAALPPRPYDEPVPESVPAPPAGGPPALIASLGSRTELSDPEPYARHLQLAAQMAIGQAASELVPQARAQLVRWQRAGARPAAHVARWQQLLTGSQQEIGVRLSRLSRGEALRLFSDSPFGTRPRARPSRRQAVRSPGR